MAPFLRNLFLKSRSKITQRIDQNFSKKWINMDNNLIRAVKNSSNIDAEGKILCHMGGFLQRARRCRVQFLYQIPKKIYSLSQRVANEIFKKACAKKEIFHALPPSKHPSKGNQVSLIFDTKA